MSRKTIFILGAGFSYDAGIPLQGELLKSIIDTDFHGELKVSKDNILKFIRDIFKLTKVDAKKLALEDIYTPIHQAVANNDYLKTYSPEKLKEIENNLNLLISHVIDRGKSGEQYDDDYIRRFADKLLKDKNNARSTDHFAVMSLNWDIVLDKLLFQEIADLGVVDYVCNCTGIDNSSRMLPPLVARERNQQYAIKLIKLHGSLNWVTCPKCQRLFVNKRQKEGIQAFKGKASCRFCNNVKLNAALLLPTFQKDFGKFHFQSIWNQAGIELSEATKLVFMGYSFPLADFDFRSLITKHVGDVTVDVVLKSNHGSGDTEEGERYRNYFGRKINKTYYDGVANYIEHHLEI